MKNTKQSITLKIVVGYTLAILLGFIAFWVIYRQLNSYTEITKIKNDNSEKLFLVGEAITSLYEAESLTRNIIQTSDVEKFETYKSKIDSIIGTINKLAGISYDSFQVKKIDSIKSLVDSKNENLEELIAIYEERQEKGLYQSAIDELKKSDDNFSSYTDYDKRFRKLSAKHKKTLVNVLELSRKDNENRLTNQTVESLTASIRRVLFELEKKDRMYQQEITERENKLLKNDRIITKQLRDILAAIERSERKKYIDRLTASNDVLDRTSNFIIIITGVSLLIAIVFLFLITSDVSKSQKYRNELEAEKLYKETLLKTRESLINTVTHDLRSPLNTVIGYSNLLEKTSLNTRQKHYLDHLKKSSDYILHLVNDLLDLSKLEAGRMLIEELPFSPEKLIETTISSVIPVQDKKGLDIQIVTHKELKKKYLGDPFRIKQILTNLLNNAYKFTDRGSIIVESRIEEQNIFEKELVICVKDTGIGISKEQQKYIFKEFSQGADDTEKKYGGFGLGLAITKKIIVLLKGRITLVSEPNIGSEFEIFIPIKQAKQEVFEEDTMVEEPQYFSHQRVLIVDDDESQLSLTSEVVSLAGLSYDVCENGAEAIELINRNKYQLVLTDIQMPKMDGFELLQSLQKNDKGHLPVIALSGRTDTNAESYRDAGFIGSLRKPYAPKELIDLIAKVLDTEPKSIDLDGNEVTAKEEDMRIYSLDDLMLFAQGDSDSLYAILETFYESTKNNLILLVEGMETQDDDKIKKTAHKMLPMFKQIKAKEIIPILDQLEHKTQLIITSKKTNQLVKKAVVEIENLMELIKSENSIVIK